MEKKEYKLPEIEIIVFIPQESILLVSTNDPNGLLNQEGYDIYN